MFIRTRVLILRSVYWDTCPVIEKCLFGHGSIFRLINFSMIPVSCWSGEWRAFSAAKRSIGHGHVSGYYKVCSGTDIFVVFIV